MDTWRERQQEVSHLINQPQEQDNFKGKKERQNRARCQSKRSREGERVKNK